MNNITTITEQLQEQAERLTTPFCYSCYKDAPDGVCHQCGSDDLMRHLKGVGVEYGFDWVVEHFLRFVEAIDKEEHFEEVVRECHCENDGYVEIMGCQYDIVDTWKEIDPVAFRCSVSDYWASVDEDEYFTMDNDTFYNISDIEELIDDLESMDTFDDELLGG